MARGPSNTVAYHVLPGPSAMPSSGRYLNIRPQIRSTEQFARTINSHISAMDTSDINPEDLIEDLESLPSSHFIQCRAQSKRSAINEFQVKLFVRVARMLADATLRAYEVRDLNFLPAGRIEAIRSLPEYALFIDACYAVGFVCRDLAPKAELEQINSRPTDHVATWSLPQIRLYIHTLIRAERWADGYSSPILCALQAGTLMSVAERLERDAGLYAST